MASIFVPTLSLCNDDFLCGNGFQAPVMMGRRRRMCQPRPMAVRCMRPMPLFNVMVMGNEEQEKKKENFQVSFDLKGFNADNIKVDFDKKTRMMTVIANEEKDGFVRRYRKSFNLPENVDEEKLNAVLENGVLTMALEEEKESESKEVTMEKEPSKEVKMEVTEDSKEKDDDKASEVSVEDLGVDEEDDNKSETLSDESVFVLMENVKHPFKITVNLEGFEKENISVESYDEGIKIVAKSEETSEDGGIIEKNIVKKYPVKKQEFDLSKFATEWNAENSTLTLTIPAL